MIRVSNGVRVLLSACILTCTGCWRSRVPERSLSGDSGRAITSPRPMIGPDIGVWWPPIVQLEDAGFCPLEPISILFVVDDSPGMEIAQQRLAAAIPDFLRRLTSEMRFRDPAAPSARRRDVLDAGGGALGPDMDASLSYDVSLWSDASLSYDASLWSDASLSYDASLAPDGSQMSDRGAATPNDATLERARATFAIRVLAAATTSADLGLGSGALECEGEGDDGELLDGRESSSCAGSIVDVLRSELYRDVAGFGDEWACGVQLGAQGCAFVQPLEAALRALSPTRPRPWTSPVFTTPGNSSRFRGDDGNGGFHDHGGDLAIVFLTQFDDCSGFSDEAYRVTASEPALPSSLRCFVAAGSLMPLERYVAGFRQLRQASPIGIGVIAGIPLAIPPLDAPDSVREVLRLPAMNVRTESDPSTRIAPACALEGVRAEPARRLIEVAGALGEEGAALTIGSLCAPQYDTFFERFADTLLDRIAERCR